jgi:hypothetical protein
MGRFLRPTTNTVSLATPLTDGQEHAHNDSFSQQSRDISDASQHIDQLRTDLQNVNIAHLTPTTPENRVSAKPSRRRPMKKGKES